MQTTVWFLGGPNAEQEVDPAFIMAEAEAHLISAHFTSPKRIFV